jgi:dTDP-D-glucose 4,6-dehydratase
MVRFVADRKGHDRRYALDDSLLRGMGYVPRICFAAGLRSTVRWYQENRRWWEALKRPVPWATAELPPIRLGHHAPGVALATAGSGRDTS